MSNTSQNKKILHSSLANIHDAVIPDNLSAFIKQRKDCVTILSDLTGQKEISIFLHDNTILVSDSLDYLIKYLNSQTNYKLSLRATSISHLLHDAIIPAPFTIYNEVISLSIGNSLEIDPATGQYEILDDYPYLRALSRQDSVYSTQTLLQLIADSIQQGTNNLEPVLLLSSGKDSVSLAIACGELGLKCHAVTFKSGNDDCESDIAKKIASQFGLKHEVIPYADNWSSEETILEFFRNSVHPCVDFAQLGYMQLLNRLGTHRNLLMDGTGNDSYFGGVPCKTDYLKYRYTIGNSKISDFIKPFIRHSTKLSYLLRNDAEINFATRTFRYTDSKKWFSQAINTSEYWRNRFVKKRLAEKNSLQTYYIDLEAHIRGRDYDRSCSIMKTRLSASYTGKTLFYPYCNSKLIDYCFNLPESYRFNWKLNINKIALRNLLNEKVQYDSLTRTKRGFNFEGRNFINQHKSFIEREILDCNLWEADKVEPFLSQSMKKLDSNYYESHGIMTLFLLSGWLNHNMYLSY